MVLSRFGVDSLSLHICVLDLYVALNLNSFSDISVMPVILISVTWDLGG